VNSGSIIVPSLSFLEFRRSVCVRLTKAGESGDYLLGLRQQRGAVSGQDQPFPRTAEEAQSRRESESFSCKLKAGWVI